MIVTSDQAAVAKKMLTGEVDSFSRNDQDVEYAPGLELDIKLTDDKPVQKNYASIPRLFYEEVKGCTEDLQNCKFLKPSKSLCVCFRKRHGTLRLGISYRALSQKTIQGSHPLPRIQEALDKTKEKLTTKALSLRKANY